MLNTDLWLSFVLAVSIIAITPGPSVLLAMANSIDHGFQKNIGTILGDLSANLIQIILASLGLTVILQISNEAFMWMKWFGVGYLLYIGVTKFSQKGHQSFGEKKKTSTWKGLYANGFLVSISNPKAILFFATIFPLFMDLNYNFYVQTTVLAITYLSLDALSLIIYSFFAVKLRNRFIHGKYEGLQNKIIGGLLILCGLFFGMIKKVEN